LLFSADRVHTLVGRRGEVLAETCLKKLEEAATGEEKKALSSARKKKSNGLNTPLANKVIKGEGDGGNESPSTFREKRGRQKNRPITGGAFRSKDDKKNF